MKTKKLLLITVALITLGALLLTTGLFLIHGTAFEATPDEAVIDGEQNTSAPALTTPEIKDEATEDEPDISLPSIKVESTEDEVKLPEEDTPNLPTPALPAEAPKYEFPEFEYTLVDAEDMHYCGCKQEITHSAHYELKKGITIDVYSHKTGELVGQLAIASEEIENYVSSLMAETFSPWAQTFEPSTDAEPINLPYGDYRIEVYGGTWFSYTYGVNSMFELTQCTLTFYGGEKLTSYIDFLIADYIAEIEAGNIQKPNPEKAVSKLEFHGLEGYWYGYWIEEYTWTPNGWQGYQYEGAGRFTERFPYANKD